LVSGSDASGDSSFLSRGARMYTCLGLNEWFISVGAASCCDWLTVAAGCHSYSKAESHQMKDFIRNTYKMSLERKDSGG
jgi:hypothetical protein